ncbi:MAG TPA: NAD-dependent epimerase/dehydratase family protein [Candidatus Saccharimonadales bacterium]|nr:NAD-dependent epimerase/dehydratase family protein [Candidatus Saccharimonadales bacterium]
MKQLDQQTILILGGDGYLGWSLGLAFANRTDKQVILVDNLIKRKWEREVDAKLLVPLKSPRARIAEYKRIFGKTNLSFEKTELLDPKAVTKLVKKYRPGLIINAAQQPSAPFSMKSPSNAAQTFSNNIVGHLNVLWAIAETDKNIRYIKLGSAGCYMDSDTSFVPLTKKDFTFKHNGKTHRVVDAYLPMQATDFYHQSKISDFLIDDLCAKIWGLRVVTVQQSTIFGATIDENHPAGHRGLSARFNYDAVFSTVLNRFICQLAIGHPLTVYGDGEQKTGLISLSDTIDNFLRLAEMNIEPGKHVIVHNYTHRLTIKEIAEKIAAIDPSVKIKYVKNPRQENFGKLAREVEVHLAVKDSHADKDKKLEDELRKMIEFTKRYKENIDRSIIMPKVDWVVKESDIDPRRIKRSLRKVRTLSNSYSKSLQKIGVGSWL